MLPVTIRRHVSSLVTSSLLSAMTRNWTSSLVTLLLHRVVSFQTFIKVRFVIQFHLVECTDPLPKTFFPRRLPRVARPPVRNFKVCVCCIVGYGGYGVSYALMGSRSVTGIMAFASGMCILCPWQRLDSRYQWIITSWTSSLLTIWSYDCSVVIGYERMCQVWL